MGKDVIVACDFPNGHETLKFLDQFSAKKQFVKIGMELFYSEGPEIVRAIHDRGHRIFLDLKLHDIPNTVTRAMRVLSSLKVDIINVHAAGGCAMMQGAREALDPQIKLIAVTQLTSTDEEMLHKELMIPGTIADTVRVYAENAKRSGLDGVVCSPLEVGMIHAACGNSFLTITPGVRFSGGDVQDQKRVMTPAEAKKIGSDYIVMGRPITQDPDPVSAYQRALSDFAL